MVKIKMMAGALEELRAEVRCSAQARQQHRIHAVLLVASGLSCRGVARLLGDSPRTVASWVKRYKSNSINGLFNSNSAGRPPRMSAIQLAELRAVIAAAPMGATCGWSGAEVSAFVARQWGVALGLRQSQRLLARMRLY